MATWNAMTPEAKDTALPVVRQEAAQFFVLVDSDGAWEAPSGAGHWKVRDLVGHLVDTTEASFVSFDAARNQREVDPAYGLPGMGQSWGDMAQRFRTTSGPNAGDTRISLTEEGFSYATGEVDDVTVLEFDPASFVLNAFGRSNAGTIRGDRAVAAASSTPSSGSECP